MTDLMPIRRALVSASDKTGLVETATALAAIGVEIISTGGTASALREAGLAVREVAALSGFPEILGGRVKTLVPQIHGGILARRDHPEHAAELARYGICPIDLVLVSLYPFAAAAERGDSPAECLETIDIGGPALIRAAAKNHEFVAVLTDPADYAPVLAEIAAEGGTRLATRRLLAQTAFACTAAYDAAIASWLAGQASEALPERLILSARRCQRLRYGENPQQKGAFYAFAPAEGLARASQIQGKELSWNNLNDAEAAVAAVAEFDAPAAVVVKHASPCGAAIAPTPALAWELALACDPASAFGGIVAFNRLLDEETAERIGAVFTEVILAPGASEAARAILARKRNLRLLLNAAPAGERIALRSVAGGLLAQTADGGRLDPAALKVVTERAPSRAETADLLFAERVCKHVKSNAVVLAREGACVGIGGGQTSRRDAARMAACKAAKAARAGGRAEASASGLVAASDGFFPFPDGLEVLIAAGVRAVIQPGGGLRDAEVIACADAAGIAMVFTGVRHFRH